VNANASHPEPSPDLGHRRIRRAAAVLLAIALCTCVYTTITNARTVLAAGEDKRIVSLMLAADQAGAALDAESSGQADSTAADATFAALADAAQAAKLDTLQLDGLGRADSLKSLLGDPVNALTEARTTGQLGLLAVELSQAQTQLADNLANGSLSGHAHNYAQASTATVAGGGSQPSLDVLTRAADSLYSSSRARLMAGLAGAVATAAGLLFLTGRMSVAGLGGRLAAWARLGGATGRHSAPSGPVLYQRMEAAVPVSYQPASPPAADGWSQIETAADRTWSAPDAPVAAEPVGYTEQQPSPLFVDAAETAVPGQLVAAPAETAVPGQPFAAPAETAVPGQPFAAPAETAVPGQPFAAPAETAVPGQPFAAPAETAVPGQPFAAPAVPAETAVGISFWVDPVTGAPVGETGTQPGQPFAGPAGGVPFAAFPPEAGPIAEEPVGETEVRLGQPFAAPPAPGQPLAAPPAPGQHLGAPGQPLAAPPAPGQPLGAPSQPLAAPGQPLAVAGGGGPFGAIPPGAGPIPVGTDGIPANQAASTVGPPAIWRPGPQPAPTGAGAGGGQTASDTATHPATQEFTALSASGTTGPFLVTDVLKEALAQVSRPHQVRWAIQTMATVPEALVPRLAHVVAELVDAAAAKSPSLAVRVAARSTATRLIVTVSDRAPAEPPGHLALGPKPGAVFSLIRRLNGSLTGSPAAAGGGTDTILTVPIPTDGRGIG
jgi:hypothetical protein